MLKTTSFLLMLATLLMETQGLKLSITTTLLAATQLALAHNGVIHIPGESSSITVGPSLRCDECFLNYNYGLNYMKRWSSDDASTSLPWNASVFPLCAVEDGDGPTLAVGDDGTGVGYYIGAQRASDLSGCPSLDSACKFVTAPDDTIELFDLGTGTTYSVLVLSTSVTCTEIDRYPSPSLPDWPAAWGDLTSEAPLFYASLTHGGCKWYVSRRDGVRIEAAGCGDLRWSPKINDNGDDTTHEGGDFVVAGQTLYYANGEGSRSGGIGGSSKLASPSQDDGLFAGKLLRVTLTPTGVDVVAVAAGLRHPWTAVSTPSSIIVADVGSKSAEEITIVPLDDVVGSNFGWPICEGQLGGMFVTEHQSRHSRFVKPTIVDNRRAASADAPIMHGVLFAIVMVLVTATRGTVGSLPLWWWSFAMLAATVTCPALITAPDYEATAGLFSTTPKNTVKWTLPPGRIAAHAIVFLFVLCSLAAPLWFRERKVTAMLLAGVGMVGTVIVTLVLAVDSVRPWRASWACYCVWAEAVVMAAFMLWTLHEEEATKNSENGEKDEKRVNREFSEIVVGKKLTSV